MFDQDVIMQRTINSYLEYCNKSNSLKWKKLFFEAAFLSHEQRWSCFLKNKQADII